MQLHHMMFLAILSTTFLSGCTGFRSEKNIVAISPLPKVENQFQPKIAWRHLVGNGSGGFYSNLHPAKQSNRVFAADRHGIVEALDASTGKKIWSKDLSIHTDIFSSKHPAKLSGGLAVANGRVYVGSELAKVYALDAENGNPVWETNISSEALSTPVVSDRLVLIHSSNGMLHALDEENGTIKWTLNLDMPSSLTLRGECTPAKAFGTAIIGGDDGRISAVMIDQGDIIWQNRISETDGGVGITRINDAQTTPIVLNGVVYALAYNGSLSALNLKTGELIWSKKIGSATNILVDGDQICLVDQNDRVVSVKALNGVTLWGQDKLMHRNLTSPVLFNGYIVTGDSEGYLHFIDKNNGCFVAQKEIDRTGLLSDPIVDGNLLILQAKDGMVYAISG